MVAEDGNNGAWHGDTEGRCSTFTISLFYESAEQKAGRPKKYKGLWFSLLH